YRRFRPSSHRHCTWSHECGDLSGPPPRRSPNEGWLRSVRFAARPSRLGNSGGCQAPGVPFGRTDGFRLASGESERLELLRRVFPCVDYGWPSSLRAARSHALGPSRRPIGMAMATHLNPSGLRPTSDVRSTASTEVDTEGTSTRN